MWAPHTILHLPQSSPHLNTLPYFFHIPPYLTKLPKISRFFHHLYFPKFSTLPRFFPILPHTYFIIYPILKCLTFFIYCLISIAVKYTRPIKIFENKNKKNGNTTSKLFKKFCVIMDIRNNAFLLSGSTVGIIHRPALYSQAVSTLLYMREVLTYWLGLPVRA